MINKNDAILTDQWRDLPMDQQMFWYLPLELMIDIPRLRARYPLLLTSEYLLLQGLDPEQESTRGWWDRSYYHSGLDQPDLYVIPNKAYEPEGVVRVDTLISRPLIVSGGGNTTNSTDLSNSTKYANGTEAMVLKLSKVLDSTLVSYCKEKKEWALSWTEATVLMSDVMTVLDDDFAEYAFEKAGWVVLHTFEGQYVLLSLDWRLVTNNQRLIVWAWI